MRNNLYFYFALALADGTLVVFLSVYLVSLILLQFNQLTCHWCIDYGIDRGKDGSDVHVEGNC